MRLYTWALALAGALLLCTPAHAEEGLSRHRVALGVQLGATTNDPFVVRKWLGGEVALAVGPVAEVYARGLLAPDLGTSDWKPITTQLIAENHVSPDISKLIAQGELGMSFNLVSSPGRRFRVPLSLGLGLVRTRDDLHALQAEDEPEAQATELQNHPATCWHLGAMGRPLDWLELGVELSSIRYIEVIHSTTLESKNLRSGEVRARFLFGRRP